MTRFITWLCGKGFRTTYYNGQSLLGDDDER